MSFSLSSLGFDSWVHCIDDKLAIAVILCILITQATNYHLVFYNFFYLNLTGKQLPLRYFITPFHLKQATNYHGHHTRTRKAKDAWIDNQVAFAESAALSRKRRESQRKECLGYKVETKGKSKLK